MKYFARAGLAHVFCLSACVTGALWVTLPNSARAEVTITGNSKDAKIEASNATLEELLSALHDKLDLTYSSATPLDHKVMDGTFVGALTKILTPLLKDYDHVMKVQNGRIFLVLTERQKSRTEPISTVAAAAPSVPAASEPTELAANGPDEPSKNKLATNLKSEKVVSPNGPSPPPASSSSPPPSPFAVTTFLETQSVPFLNRGATATNVTPPSDGVGVEASQQASQLASQQASQQAAQQAAVAQTMQRANIALQSLAKALNNLPK